MKLANMGDDPRADEYIAKAKELGLTKAEFRRQLNEINLANMLEGDKFYKNGRYRQIKQLEGDYLYTNDKVLFDMYFCEWIKQGGGQFKY